jgi:hypothetical protein
VVNSTRGLCANIQCADLRHPTVNFLHNTIWSGNGEMTEAWMRTEIVCLDELVHCLFGHGANDDFFASAMHQNECHVHELWGAEVPFELKRERRIIWHIHAACVVTDKFQSRDYIWHDFLLCSNFHDSLAVRVIYWDFNNDIA